MTEGKPALKLWIVNHYAIPPSYGGLNRHFYFSRELKKKGVKTKIITSSKIHNSNINLIQDAELFREKMVDGVEYTFVKTGNYKGNGLKRIFSFIQFPVNVYRTMKRLSSEELPDVIYASSPELFATWVAIKFAKRIKIPIVVEIRDLWPESVVAYSRFTKNNPIIKALYRLEKWIYTKADSLIFTFEGGIDYIKDKNWDVERGGTVDLSKIHYLNNGVDFEEFQRNSNEFKVMDTALDSDNFKVVYTGSVRRVNSVHLIVEVAEQLNREAINDIVFIIYGDGTEKERLINKCKDEGLTNIFFRDRIEKKYIPYILKKADATIFVGEPDPMNKYGLSLNKLFDYMAAGKPVISNIETKHDIILKYGCGIVATNGGKKEIRDAILSLRDMDKASYSKMCDNALKASKYFDYRHLTNILYDVLIKNKRGNKGNETEQFIM
ncbi:MAG: glycosyltransferase family 4 protein [Candidatus Fimisoma sp.]|nr:glycosyltransferase family 4 protein [Candidatus Fimisoma sp.]